MMKAIVKASRSAGARLAQVPIPQIAPDELLVRVHSASLSPADLAAWSWKGWIKERMKLPRVLGREFCGEVVEIGEQARGFAKGDFVSAESHVFCGQCYQCRNDQRHVCSNLKVLGLDVDGGLAEYARVPARCAWKHNDETLKEMGALLEPFGNAVHAVQVEDVVGRSVLVTSCCPQGLFAIAVAKAGGAKPVIALESSAYRRSLAKKMGADTIIDPSAKGALEKVLKAAGGRGGVDAVLEMSGEHRAIDLGLKALRPGGRFTAFGIPETAPSLDYAGGLAFKGARLYGISGREIFATWYRVENLLRSGAVDIRPVVTHTLPFADHRKAFAMILSREKKCGKVILKP
ncbi:MAG TPA: zinc-binding dehydrogenase [Elusimicrobiales bacterium]|nr:zinc-binding dehydrogenase [Elusimicrobiales bacterium]